MSPAGGGALPSPTEAVTTGRWMLRCRRQVPPLLSALAAVVTLVAAAEVAVIAPERAREFAGHEAVVLGRVTQLGESNDGKTLFLNFGGSYPHHVFNVVASRSRLASVARASLWEGKLVRVRGRIQLYKGKGMPEIVLEREDQLTIEEAAVAPGVAPDRVAEGAAEGAVHPDAPPGQTDSSDTRPVMDFDAPPRVLKQVRPQYPQEAFVKKIEGTVLVEALVDSQGRVTRARVIQSVPLLDAAALAACFEWRFRPAFKGGHPVATIIHMPVAFRIYGRAIEQRKQRPARKP